MSLFLEILLSLVCIVYIESQTLILERLFNYLFPEKEIEQEPVPVFIEPKTEALEVDLTTKIKKDIEWYNDFVFNSASSSSDGILSLEAEDDSYVPQARDEVSN